MYQKTVSVYFLMVSLTLSLAVSGEQLTVAPEEYPDGAPGQRVRDKIALVRQQAERLKGGIEAIDKPFTLTPDSEIPEHCKRLTDGSDTKTVRAELEDGSAYTFYSWSDKVLHVVSYCTDSTGRTGFEIVFKKDDIIKEAGFKRDGKWDDFVEFHRSSGVAEEYSICNEDGDIVRRLEWDEKGKLIFDETFEKPVVFPFPASKEDEERVKAAAIERVRHLREKAAKRPRPTPKPLTPIEDARQYVGTKDRDPDVVREKFQALIDADPDNPENFFHEVDIVNVLIAPGIEKWQSEKQNHDEANDRIRQVLKKYPERQNNLQMLLLRCYLAIDIGQQEEGYTSAAEQFNFVLDFPQDKIIVRSPYYQHFPLPPEEAEHLKTDHPEKFEKLEQRWKQLVEILRKTAAGSYASLEHRRGGILALEQLATQRPDDAIFQKKVQASLDYRRKKLQESIMSHTH